MTSTASEMVIARRIEELRAALDPARSAGTSIALVPTMGFLHEGHLRLVDVARRHADAVVMSIFVNPLQFGPREDLAVYPRDADGDARKAHARGVDVLFTPSNEELYPGVRQVVVTPLALADRWEGAARPGHFSGVLTVVAKLFNLVQPDVAVFGQKDIQQATLIRAMVEDLDYPIRIIVAPTVREPDGLAMSSRNSYLRPEERLRATVLFRALSGIASGFDRGERDAHELVRRGREVLGSEPDVRVEYLALVDPQRFEPVDFAETGSIAVVAAHVGATRLIDNVILGAA